MKPTGAFGRLLLLFALLCASLAPANASPFGLKFLHKGTTSQAVICDTRFGTSTDASCWITFGLKSGARQVWADPSGGNDANSCLSFALRCATYNRAFTVWQTGAAPGDQLMLAGTGGRSYSDSISGTCCYGFANFTNSGATAQYPYAVLSYDPADPTNAAKYGKLVGPDMPVLNLTGGNGTSGNDPSLSAFGGSSGYLAVQGIEIRGRYTGLPGVGASADGIAYGNNTGTHPYIAFQNDRFLNAGLTFLGGQYVNVSKSSFVGGYGIFTDISTASGDCHDVWMQDLVMVHAGWGATQASFTGITASRYDTTANGGAVAFSHSFYIHAGCLLTRQDRIFSVDSSNEGVGTRSGAIGTQLVSFDAPTAFSISHYNVDQTEQPLGFLVQLDDLMASGGDVINGNTLGDIGIAGEAAFIAGSYVRNVALFDNPRAANQSLLSFTRAYDAASELTSAIAFDKISSWNYAHASGDIGFIEGRYPTHISQTLSNSTFESSIDPTVAHGCCGVGTFTWASTLSGSSITGTTTRSSAPGTYKTEAQVIAAEGFASKAALVNMAAFRPDLPWAQSLLAIGLPAMGLTPYYPTASPPDTTAITPPAYYRTSLVDLTLSSSTFTRSVAKSVVLSGTSANFTLACADLPAGFSLTGRTITYNGSGSGAASPTIHVVETSTDTLGTHTSTFTLTIS